MGAIARTIEVEKFDESAWAPSGWAPIRDTDPHDGDHRLRFEWDDVHLNVIGHSLDEVERTTRGLRCDTLFHHVTHTQAVMPLNCDCVFVVAPAGAVIKGAEDLADVRASPPPPPGGRPQPGHLALGPVSSRRRAGEPSQCPGSALRRRQRADRPGHAGPFARDRTQVSVLARECAQYASSHIGRPQPDAHRLAHDREEYAVLGPQVGEPVCESACQRLHPYVAQDPFGRDEASDPDGVVEFRPMVRSPRGSETPPET